MFDLGFVIFEPSKSVEDDSPHVLQICNFVVDVSDLGCAHVLPNGHHFQSMIDSIPFLLQVLDRWRAIFFDIPSPQELVLLRTPPPMAFSVFTLAFRY